MPELPKRKYMRLQGYDYSQSGYYFVTICTKDRKFSLCNIVGDGLCAVPKTELFPIGNEVDNAIRYIDNNYENIKIDKYVIMPNHIHLIIVLKKPETGGCGNPETGGCGNPETGGCGNPPLPRVIGQLKSFTTKQYGGVLWQRGYYDHIIRDENDYIRICEYIENNPLKWEKDKYYEN